MWWECSECGHHIEEDRPMKKCSNCGIAGASFVPAAGGLQLDPSSSDLRECWINIGMAQAQHDLRELSLSA